MTIAHSQTIRGVVNRAIGDPDRFNSVVLGRGAYWSRQREVCRSVTKYRTTAVHSGNGVGKSYLLAGLIAWAGACHPGSKTVIAAPTQDQLRSAVWAEFEAAYNGSRVPLGGKVKSLSWQIGDNWQVEGYGSGSIESKSGRHARDLFAFIDEASGVSADVLEAIDSLNPSKVVMMGNPIKPDGKFYDTCQTIKSERVNALRISSLESPHATWDRSEWGLADRTWLEEMAAAYGEDSLWWRVHILGLFPDSADDSLIPREWLDLALMTIHVRSGPRRMAIDLAKGTGGDQSVIIVRDDNGVCALEHSNQWTLEETAKRARVLADDWGVVPGRITFDATNLGTDFGNRLDAIGLRGSKGYMGSMAGGAQFGSLRDAAHWAMRQRLDPRRSKPKPLEAQPKRPLPPGISVIQKTDLKDGLAAGKAGPGASRIYLDQKPFAIGREFMAKLRPELQGLKYSLDERGRIVLEAKEDFAKRLRHSPDFADSLAMSFAFPNA